MGLYFSNGLKMADGLRAGIAGGNCCCNGSGCSRYAQGYDACTFETLDVWICAESPATGVYKLPDDSITKIRFMIGSHFQHVSSTPGTIYNLSDFVEDTDPCDIPIDPDPCVLIACGSTTVYDTIDTVEIIQHLTLTSSDTFGSPLTWTTPTAGPNEIIMILHTSGLFKWTSPSPDFIESYTANVCRTDATTACLGCTTEIEGTREDAEAFFFQEGACCQQNYTESTPGASTPSSAATYDLYPGKFVGGTIDAGWTVSGLAIFTVFRITLIP